MYGTVWKFRKFFLVEKNRIFQNNQSHFFITPGVVYTQSLASLFYYQETDGCYAFLLLIVTYYKHNGTFNVFFSRKQFRRSYQNPCGFGQAAVIGQNHDIRENGSGGGRERTGQGGGGGVGATHVTDQHCSPFLRGKICRCDNGYVIDT